MKTKTSFKKGHKPLYTVSGKDHHQFKHGMGSTKVRNLFYSKWCGMKRRCYNKNENSYKSYGGRGIKVCDKWMSFKGFYEDMFPSYVHGLSLDRIDNDKGYSKKNCRWVTMTEQARNKRSVKLYTYKGETLTAREWSDRTDIGYYNFRARLVTYGWSIEKALKTPNRGKNIYQLLNTK